MTPQVYLSGDPSGDWLFNRQNKKTEKEDKKTGEVEERQKALK